MSAKVEHFEGSISVTARSIVNRVAELSVRVWRSSEFEPAPTLADAASLNTARARQTGLYHNHPLASLFGKYDQDPLWGEFEKAVQRLREEDGAALD